MEKKTVSGTMLTLTLIGMLTLAFNIHQVKAKPTIWTVDDDGPADFQTIQEAINTATAGDTIIVYSGTYIENVNVNKRLTIQSQSGVEVTIVQVANPDDHVFEVAADYVEISGFTVKGTVDPYAGIDLGGVSYCSISNNLVSNNEYGIFLRYSNINEINNNIVSDNKYGINVVDSNNNGLNDNVARNNTFNGISLSHSNNNELNNNTALNNRVGIRLCESSRNELNNNIASGNQDGIFLDASNNNSLSGNIASNNFNGIYLFQSSSNKLNSNIASNNSRGIIFGYCQSGDNIIYLNDFIDNIENVHPYNETFHPCNPLANTWHSPEEITYTHNGRTFTNYLGNYWSDYSGEDEDGDCIGDTPYNIEEENSDHYPLMSPSSEIPLEGEALFWMEWWFYVILAIVIVALAGAIYFFKKRKPPTPTAPPPARA